MESMRKKRRRSEEYLKLGFTVIVKGGTEVPQCVICARVLQPAAMNSIVLQQHLNSYHSEMKGKDVDYFRHRETMLNSLKLDLPHRSNHQENKATLYASYEIALNIAQQKQPHSTGEMLIMPCIKEMVRIMGGEQDAKKLDTLSLSANTVQQCISDMSTDIKDQVVSEIKTAPLGIFALQLDETTDVNNCDQLLVFTRYIKDDEFKEEFLFCHPLEASTTSADIFELLNSFFEREGLDWENVCGCTTDGAPAILGSQSGFKTRIKAVNSKVKYVHSMTHRQALVAKTVPTELKEVLDDTVKMVNLIKSGAPGSTLIRRLCSDLDSVHEALLDHTDVRWLSHGNVLESVFELKDELKWFFSCNDNKEWFFSCDDNKETQVYLAKLNDPKWISHLAYLVDIFTRLNILNKSFEGADAVVIDAVDKLKSFQMKLELWKTKVKKGNFDMFETLADMQDTATASQMMSLIVDHLSSLQNEITRYFPDVSEGNLKLIRDPFHTDVASVNDAIQEEFIDLANDSSACDLFERVSLVRFWCKISKSYPHVAEEPLRYLLTFPSTYLCETGLSTLLVIKSNLWSQLNVEADLRCALAKTAPRVAKLVDEKVSAMSLTTFAADDLQIARRRANRAEKTSNVESEEEPVRKRKRTRRYSPSSNASSEEEYESGPPERARKETRPANTVKLPPPPSFSGIPKAIVTDEGKHGLPEERASKQSLGTDAVNLPSTSISEIPATSNAGFQMSVLRRLDNIIERLDAHEKLLRTMESNSSSHSAEKLSSIMEDIIPRPLDAREDIEEFNRKLEDASFAKLVVKLLGSLGGRKLGETVKAILQKLGTNRLWSTYSLKGMRKKLALTELQQLYKVILKACLQSHPNKKLHDVDDELIECLKHAPGKRGGYRYRYKESATRRESEESLNSINPDQN